MPQSQSGTPSVGWIKFLAIVTAWLTIILVALIIVLGMFVWRLEVLTDSLVASRRSAQLSSPTAEQSPTPTTEPVLKALTLRKCLIGLIAAATDSIAVFLSTRQRQSDMNIAMTSSQHLYEVRPRKDRRCVDLISDQIRSACAMQDGVRLALLHFLQQLTDFRCGRRNELDTAPFRLR